MSDKKIKPVDVINHGVRRLAFCFLGSIISGIILSGSLGTKLKNYVGTENYDKITTFIALFLPLLIVWAYNKITIARITKREEEMESQISSAYSKDDIASLSPEDRELVMESMDEKSKLLKMLKTLKENKKSI